MYRISFFINDFNPKAQKQARSTETGQVPYPLKDPIIMLETFKQH